MSESTTNYEVKETTGYTGHEDMEVSNYDGLMSKKSYAQYINNGAGFLGQ